MALLFVRHHLEAKASKAIDEAREGIAVDESHEVSDPTLNRISLSYMVSELNMAECY